MKRQILLSLVAGTVAAWLTSAANAAFVQRDSADFVSTVDQIEGDVVPTTLTDWSDVASAFITANGDGTLEMVTPDDAFPAIKHNEGDDDFSSSNGWTWETRFRVDSANDPDRGVWEIFVRDNDPAPVVATRIHFMAGGIARDVFNFGASPEIAVDLTDGFHVVRGAVDADNLTSVWIDGNLVIDGLASSTFDASEFSRVGRWGGQARGGTSTIDYIRFDTTGPYSPIPEPSIMVLAGLGLVSLLPLRRR